MVNIGSKVIKKEDIKNPFLAHAYLAATPESKIIKPIWSDLEKADLLECCYTWQYAYKSKRQFPKTERMWIRIEELIKKLS